MEKKALIVYFSSYGQTAKVSNYIADILKEANYIVDVFPVERKKEIKNISGYDRVILGCPIYLGKHSKRMSTFVKDTLPALKQTTTAFFSVSLSVMDKEDQPAQDVMTNFLADCKWNPNHTALFAGSLPYTKYGFINRWIMQKIARDKGLATATSVDFEFTDWDQVKIFAEQLERK